MKRFLTTLAFAFTVFTSVAQADIVVPYGRWVSLPYCGGLTKLECADVPYARQTNQCYVQFRGVACQNVKMYVGNDFYPTWYTFESPIQSSFYVDNSKVSHQFWGGPVFNVFLSLGYGNNSVYEKIQYQFNY